MPETLVLEPDEEESQAEDTELVEEAEAQA